MKKEACQHYASLAGVSSEVLGRILGPASGEGNEMAQWVLKANRNVVPRRAARPLHADELHNPQEIKKRETFDALIERRWGTSGLPPPVSQLKQSEHEAWDEHYDED